MVSTELPGLADVRGKYVQERGVYQNALFGGLEAMSVADWIALVVFVIPFCTIMIGFVLLFIPDAIVAVKDLAEGIVEEWRKLPGRLK